MLKDLILISVVTVVLVSAACGPTRDMNVNMRNTNATMTPTSTPTPRPLDANVTREDYDRNREEYERDKGSSTIGQGINDSWLWFKTRAALATTDDLRDSTINVDVANDVITLKGTVANQAQKTKAEQVAKGIEGQKGVKNELLVRPADSVTNQMVNGNTAGSR